MKTFKLWILAVLSFVLFATGCSDIKLSENNSNSGSEMTISGSASTSSIGVSSSVYSSDEVDESSQGLETSSVSENNSNSGSELTVSASTSTPSSVYSSDEAETSSQGLETSSTPEIQAAQYKFRNQNLLDQHYEKHGKDMGFSSAEEYEKAAAAVPNDPEVLHKTEKEDGDDVFYIECTNEFVVISTDGFIRTYFNPDRGIDYYNKQ